MPHRGFNNEGMLGGDLADRELLAGLAKLGVEIHVPLFGARKNEVSFPNTFFYPSGWKSTYGTGTIIPNAVYFSRIASIHRNKPIDVIRMYNQDYGYSAFAARKVFGIPIVWNYHHLEGNFNERWQTTLFAKSFDALTTVSEASKADLIRVYGLPHERVHVIPNGVSSFYRPIVVDRSAYERHGIGKSKVLLFVGAVIPRKNLSFLLEVFAGVRNIVPDVVLVFCGEDLLADNSHLDALKKKATDLGIQSQVIFRGKVSEQEKLDWYNLCDIFVFPSLKEGFGFAAAEAMACGKPVVCSDTSSLPEIVENGETGWTVSPTDHDAFADRIVSLCSSELLRQRFGRAGCEKVLKTFQWERTAQMHYDLFTSLMTERDERKKNVYGNYVNG